MSQEKATINTTALQQIAAIKADDHLVLKALYQDNYPGVEKFVLANNGSADEARDVFQEAFLACWRNIQMDRFVPESGNALSGYLYRIARNKWMDHLRSGRYLKTVPLVEEQVEQAEEEEVEPQQAAYLKAVRENFTRLGQNCQDVLTRFYFKKESMSEIAQAYDWTDATARNTKYRCLQKLKEFLKTK